MLQSMTEFFDVYPNNLFQIKGKRPSDIDPDLMKGLKDYKERQQLILNETHSFRFDEDSVWMLRRLITEMKKEGLEEIFHTVRLPFPAILLEGISKSADSESVGFVTQVGENIYTQRFLVSEGGLVPSLIALQSTGLEATVIPTPTQDFFRSVSDQPDMTGIIEEEQLVDNYFLGIAVAMATLLKHRGMLTVEQTSAFSRPERRRAKKDGRILPATRVSKITLGESGRGQFDAMREGALSNDSDKVRRRAHWVRGHFMRNPTGGLSWRMPHIRGAGPLINQERHVTAEK